MNAWTETESKDERAIRLKKIEKSLKPFPTR
jgi:hypothetical protein